VTKLKKYKAVVIGTSAGGLKALKRILPRLSSNYPLPLLIVQHISPLSDNYMSQMLNDASKITVKEADEKEKILPSIAYIAPPDYHMLVENDKTISLSVEEKVNYSRPSIDVLFETAADAFGDKLIGIILTGANPDGAKGLKKIKDAGGMTIVQSPDDAESKTMPEAAINITKPDYIFSIDEIITFLTQINP